MIITIFGDVHGNLIALEKLYNLENSKTDLFISHGDVVNYGPWSNECVNFLNESSKTILLKGNHEQYFINGAYPGQNLVAKSFFNFCYPQFNSKYVSLIQSYDESKILDNFIVKHTIGEQYIFLDTDISNLNIETNYIIGHSHQQYSRIKNEFYIYNTGSIGQNRKYLNQSCYLQLDTETNHIELKYFIHDVNKVINEMESQKYPKICLDYYLSKERLVI
jgi:predicted phosphodiesterase